MLVKAAKKIVDGMVQGLKDLELNKAINALGYETDSKDFNAVRNEYVQHSWDAEDLAGPRPAAKATPAPKASKKPTKAAKKVAKKATKPVKKSDEGKRIGKDGQVIIAYPKPQGRTRVMFACVLAGASNALGLELIQKQFGKSSPTTVSSLGWVRSQLRNNPDRWLHGKNGPKYGCSSKLIKAVKADRDCATMTLKALEAKVKDFVVESDDESEDE